QLRHEQRTRDVIEILEQARHRQRLEARIDADKKLGRSGGGFDGSQPQDFRLTLRAAELARWVDIEADADVCGLLQLGLVDLDEFVLDIIDGLRGKFHHEFLRAGRACYEHAARSECRESQTLARRTTDFSDTHMIVPPMCVWIVAARSSISTEPLLRRLRTWCGVRAVPSAASHDEIMLGTECSQHCPRNQALGYGVSRRTEFASPCGTVEGHLRQMRPLCGV